MKKILLLLSLFCFLISSNAQSVTFYNDGVIYDDEPLLMNGYLGDWTNYQYVDFVNKSGNTVQVEAHLHSDLDFIYFVDSENQAGQILEVTIPNNATYTLNVIAFLSGVEAIAYNDELGFEITYEDNRSGYFELDASAYFYNKQGGSSNDHSSNGDTSGDHSTAGDSMGDNSTSGNTNNGDSSNGNTTTTSSNKSFSQPKGYHFIDVNGKPARWKISDLPLTIYSNHASYGFASDYTKVIKKAVNMWNNAGRSVGLEVGFFEYSSNSSNSEIQMDWSGKNVPGGALGVAYPEQNIIAMLPLAKYDNLGSAGEVLCQELCHLLGVEHSEVETDIMNGTAHGHFHNLSQIKITDRDREMLGWLYSQSDYYRFKK
jgi:hypothetical protein